MASSTTFSSSNCNVQRAQPAGGELQARVINRASFSPSNILFLAELGLCLRVKIDSKPSSTSCWPACRLGQGGAAPSRPAATRVAGGEFGGCGGRGKFSSSQCLEK